MSLESLLATIDASGETELAQLRAEAEARAQQILAEAESVAAARREAARRAAVFPSAGERARRLHRAKLEALRAVGEVRNGLIASTLEQTQVRLSTLRAEPDYPHVLRRLTEEALQVLGEENVKGGQFQLEVDSRDHALLARILVELGLTAPILPSLNCWGGVVVRSSDERIVVTNTLEARLERAAPFLRRDLALFFEQARQGAQAPGNQPEPEARLAMSP